MLYCFYIFKKFQNRKALSQREKEQKQKEKLYLIDTYTTK